MAKKQKTISIDTFTCQYDPKEDRLRLSLNYQDHKSRFDYWITRSFLLKLLPLLSKFAKKEMPEDVNNAGRDLSANKAVSPITNTDIGMLELTHKDAQLLERVDFKTIENNTQIIFGSDVDEIKCIATLDTNKIETVLKLLVNAAPTYEWGIGPWW